METATFSAVSGGVPGLPSKGLHRATWEEPWALGHRQSMSWLGWKRSPDATRMEEKRGEGHTAPALLPRPLCDQPAGGMGPPEVDSILLCGWRLEDRCIYSAEGGKETQLGTPMEKKTPPPKQGLEYRVEA